MQRSLRLSFALLAALIAPLTSHCQTILVQEGFEDQDLASRGWYDNTDPVLSTDEHRPGGTRSAEFHFRAGAPTPIRGGALRHMFVETDSIYLSYWVKYSENWTGSNQPYHPHEFLFTTNLDQQYIGPAYTRLTLYVEQNEGRPTLAIQDGRNIDETRIGQDLTAITEQRAVAGCNGDSDGHGDGECYQIGDMHFNGKKWDVAESWFTDTQGPRYKNDWHHVEAFFKLNNIVEGKGIADGVIRYWYDGVLVIAHDDIMFRTGRSPGMKINQFLIAPYIGDGSPIDQTMWLDDLTIATGRIGEPSAVDERTEGETGIAILTTSGAFTESPSIRFTLPRSGPTTLTVFDGIGRVIAMPLDRVLEAGEHEVRVDASTWPPGTYFCRLTTPSGMAVRPMVIPSRK